MKIQVEYSDSLRYDFLFSGFIGNFKRFGGRKTGRLLIWIPGLAVIFVIQPDVSAEAETASDEKLRAQAL